MVKFKARVRILEWNEYEVEVHADSQEEADAILAERRKHPENIKGLPNKLMLASVEDKPSPSRATLTSPQVMSIEPNDTWYVVQSLDKDGQGGKFDDGFFGWDSTIHSPEQIHCEEDIPYEKNDGMRFIIVGVGSKPSVEEAVLKLQQRGWHV